MLYFSRYRYMTFNVLSALNKECLRVVFITLYDIQCIFSTKCRIFLCCIFHAIGI